MTLGTSETLKSRSASKRLISTNSLLYFFQVLTLSCLLTLVVNVFSPNAGNSGNNFLTAWRVVDRPLARAHPAGEITKVFVVYGTRPEGIKLSPVIQELKSRDAEFSTVVCVTAQHREILDQVNGYFGITPDVDINLMTPDQSLPTLTASMLTALSGTLAQHKPDVVVVQGDTTTAFVGALAAYYQGIPVAHVEAGIRTGSIYNPFPEEVNRRIISTIASYNFAATDRARRALLMENVPERNIMVTGNTVIDAALRTAAQPPSPATESTLKKIGMWENGASMPKFVLLTAHRRESHGAPLVAICRAVLRLVDRYPDLTIVVPVHPSPRVRQVVKPLLEGKDRIKLVEPLDYEAMVHVARHAYAILTDSGGLSEEATAWGVPTLVLRLTTDRPETIMAGSAMLVGPDEEMIVRAMGELIDSPPMYLRMKTARTVYGDGKAAQRIADALAGKHTEAFFAQY